MTCSNTCFTPSLPDCSSQSAVQSQDWVLSLTTDLYLLTITVLRQVKQAQTLIPCRNLILLNFSQSTWQSIIVSTLPTYKAKKQLAVVDGSTIATS